MKSIKNYENEQYANEILEKELGKVSPKMKNPYNFSFLGETIQFQSYPELKLNQRPYFILIDYSKQYFTKIPDFKQLRENFYSNIGLHQKITMIWAIAYSRIENNHKYKMLKKYYSTDTHNSILKVAIRNKNMPLLEWIGNQLK